MHNKLTVLTQIFGQQGAFQVTAEGVLRRKHKRLINNEAFCMYTRSPGLYVPHLDDKSSS